MDTTGYVALSRQMVLQRHMTTIANNIANAGTTGYRAEHTLFEQALARPGDPEPASFVQDVGLYRDTRPGAVTQTGNQFDLAINGEGYLSFQTPAGERYGRAGHLQPDATGRLTDAAGNPVLDDGGQPVMLPDGEQQITIAADGTISAGAGQFARLQLVTFEDGDLVRVGGGLSRRQAVPRPANGGVVQGALEESNVAPVLEMTSMLATVRAFQGVQKLIDAQHELDRRAIERMISVTG
jgi:flagellar basal-body rod protein FlgF